MNGAALPELSEGQKRILLSMIREVLTVGITADSGSSRSPDAPDLRKMEGYAGVKTVLDLECGLFVTLRRRDRGGELRGCIGRMVSDKPLRDTLPVIALDSALRDRRFPPVASLELDSISLELSLLSPMVPVDSWKSIVIGTHGIYLRRGFSTAVFLPEVAVEQGWDLETTLTRLSVKGGMSPTAWREADAEFSVFTSVHFSEDRR